MTSGSAADFRNGDQKTRQGLKLGSESAADAWTGPRSRRNATARRITITSNPISETATSDLRPAEGIGAGVGVSATLDSGLGAAVGKACERRRNCKEYEPRGRSTTIGSFNPSAE